jgi:hypothetical protein
MPFRSEELAEPRRPGREANSIPLRKGELRPVTIPDPDPEWHEIAARWYNSAATSGQSDFYQDSDWAIAYLVASEIHRYLTEAPKQSAFLLQTILDASKDLLYTDGSRRRLRLELSEVELAPVVDLAEVAIQKYRDKQAAA